MTGCSAQMLGMVSDCQDDRQGAAVGRIVPLTMIHNVGTSNAQALFFFSLNGTTRVVHVLSHCPYRFLFSDSLLGLSYLFVTTDKLYFIFEKKSSDQKAI